MQRLRFICVICFSSLLLVLHAQGNEKKFFDESPSPNDSVALSEQQPIAVVSDSVKREIVKMRNAVQSKIRYDDVTWSKTVYRIIDMREKQNLPLYFPLTPTEGHKNLMTIILQGVVDKNLKVYKRGIDNSQFRPNFAKTNIEMADTALIRIFKHDSISESVLKTVDGKLAINDYTLEAFMKYQQRFLVKEVWFFDKHRSVQDYRIEAIAPILSGMPNSEFIRHIACWFKFDELRPLLTEEKISWGDNPSSDMTFDLFFSQRFYSGNILGVDDMYHRTLLDYLTNADDIKKEQDAIQRSIVNFENDLWEY